MRKEERRTGREENREGEGKRGEKLKREQKHPTSGHKLVMYLYV